MPTYLLHGFRWPRPLIRIHIVMQNLDDAAPGWIVAPTTSLALLNNFQQLYPECMQHLTRLRFIEQYDPNDITATGISQPYAYVADLVQEVKLGVEVDEVRGRGLSNEQWSAMIELRDYLAPEQKVGWYVVVCGDEERSVPTLFDAVQDSTTSTSASTRPSEALSRGDEDVPATRPSNQSLYSQKTSGSRSSFKKLMSLTRGRGKGRTPLGKGGTRSRPTSSTSARMQTMATMIELPPPLPILKSTPKSSIPSGKLAKIDKAAISNDGSSSAPSIPPSRSASTPTLPEDIAELPAYTPSTSRSNSTGRALYDNDIPETGRKAKYSRSSEISDYCVDGFPPTSQIQRRGSGSRQPRTVRRVVSFPILTSGGGTTPSAYIPTSSVGRGSTPGRRTRNQSIRDPQSPARLRSRSALQIGQQYRADDLGYNLQVLRHGHSILDCDEMIDEVIVMNPALRTPTQHLVRRPGSADAVMTLAGRSSRVSARDGVVKRGDASYFGATVNDKDVAAISMERVYERM